MIRGKKGSGQHGIIYMIFVALLMTFAIVMIYNFITKVDAETEFRIHNLEQTAITARLIYSPDCFALEEQTCSGDEYQVQPAVLDSSKITTDRVSQCLHDFTSRYNVYLKLETLGSSLSGFPKTLFKNDCPTKESLPVILRANSQNYNAKFTFCMEAK